MMLSVLALVSVPLPSHAQEPTESGLSVDTTVVTTTIELGPAAADTTSVLGTDSLPVAKPFDKWAGYNLWEERETTFSPGPTRAVWMSALFPGLGQIYNRRYWKLPIVVGGFLGLTYATTWNNNMLNDYTKAYGDAMDSDPNTKSYMDFYPPTTREEDINMDWLKRVLKSKKDFYRRNRDLCIISMVGLYLLCMVDAYVDASLANFDITPDLSMKVKPAVIEPQLGKLPAVGLQCAVSF